jgi:Ca2+-binding EF-hand superfamily protein
MSEKQAELLKWFQTVDQDNSGRIDVGELQRALTASGNSFSLGTAEKLHRMFDRERTGQIGFCEFLQLNEFISQMSQGFRNRDIDGSGRLDGAEIRQALADSGFQVSEETFQTMMRKFDRQRRGDLGFDDYIELSIFVSSVRGIFGFYDRRRSDTVVFSFDTFLAASVATY